MTTGRRLALMFGLLITVSPVSGSKAAQIVGNSTAFDRAFKSSPDVEPNEQVCVSVRIQRQRITLGHGQKQIEITLGGGACGLEGAEKISDIWVRRLADEDALDVVSAHDCPALKRQIVDLRMMTRDHRQWHRIDKPVTAGPFVFYGERDLFDLATSAGRQSAARWMRRTLQLVQPCWNTVRDDRTRRVVPSLYRALAESAR